MKELEECLEALLAEVKPIEKTEYVALTDACDRILGEDIVAQIMIPPYPKSAMDGYAVRAEDTSGCGQRTSGYIAGRGRIICRRLCRDSL